MHEGDEIENDDVMNYGGIAPAERKNFIPGVYNYCDRWCEQCVFDDRCYTYAVEKRRSAEHRELGEDPDDMEIVLRDVADSMADAMTMLKKMAEQMGIDPNSEAPPTERERRELGEGGPLQVRSMRWIERVEAIIKQVHEQLESVGLDIDRRLDRANAGAGPEVDEAIVRLTALRDACELLDRYKFFVPIKIQRAMDGLEEAATERDPDAREGVLGDALRTARLIIVSLERCEGALWQIAEFHEAWRDSAMSLLLETQAIRSAVDQATPDRVHYPRPGFDE